MADGPFEVVFVALSTVVIPMKASADQMSYERVVNVPTGQEVDKAEGIQSRPSQEKKAKGHDKHGTVKGRKPKLREK